MGSWSIYLVMFSQIVVLYWLAAPLNSRLTYQVFLGRNRQYVTASESFLRRFPPPRDSIRLAQALGACWIVGLACALLVEHSDTTLIVGLVAPMLCWTLLCFGYIGIEYVRMFKKIPVPAVRQASLARRALRDYMNPLWAYLAYALIFLVAAVYVAGYLNGRVPEYVFIGRMAGLTVASVTGSLCLIYSLRRKNQPIDDELGPIYRKIEVIGIIPLLLLIARSADGESCRISTVSNCFPTWRFSRWPASSFRLSSSILFAIPASDGWRLKDLKRPPSRRLVFSKWRRR